MTVKVDKSNAKEVVKILTAKLNKFPKSGNLDKHFGKLKRGIDGLAYQELVRKDED